MRRKSLAGNFFNTFCAAERCHKTLSQKCLIPIKYPFPLKQVNDILLCVFYWNTFPRKKGLSSLYFHSVHSYLIITCLQHASNELFSLSISLWMNECLTKVYSINLKIRESGKTRKWIVRKVLVDIS